MDTDESWNAETSATSNYYRIVLSDDYVSDGNILCFNMSKGNQTKTVERTVTRDEINAGGIFDFNISFEAELPAIFDTGYGTYPGIFGLHKGKIIPDKDITVNRMYTYPCAGTGGHTKYVRIWNSTLNVTTSWEGYKGDWHNISFNETFTLKGNETYYYEVRTGSYPQIIHAREYKAVDGGNITCDEFIDANGRTYNNWIPAIKLFREI